jgi:hypothetical protein
VRTSHSSDRSRIAAVIRSAERRRFLVLAAEYAAFSLALTLAGLILLLVLGTQILRWYWLAMPVCAVVVIIFVRRRPYPLAPYRLAQLIDRRLGLSDSLSTAWFLLHAGAESPCARLQIERAEQIAQSVRVARAIPFTRRRPWLASAALAAIALALFTTRYLVTNSLSLEPALIPIHGPVVETADLSGPQDERNPWPLFPPGSRAALTQASPPQSHDFEPQSLEPNGAGKASGVPAGTSTTENGDSPAPSSESGPSSAESRGGTEHNSGERAARQAADAKNQSASAQPNSASLLDSMKDAFSSLLSKLRSNPSAQSAPSARQSSEHHSATQPALGRERRSGQSGAQEDQSSERQNADGDAQHPSSEKAEASRVRSSADSSARNGSDSRSGIGRQDGEKALKEAEELQAMGKLAEIIGKRSANLTGDMTVETPSGKQQLKTEYSQRMGHHADLGGEINHDEIPLMYQQYVRDYMEAVRKEQERSSPP